MMCAAAAASAAASAGAGIQQGAREKIRISGGGRCNFTNLGVSPVQSCPPIAFLHLRA